MACGCCPRRKALSSLYISPILGLVTLSLQVFGITVSLTPCPWRGWGFFEDPLGLWALRKNSTDPLVLLGFDETLIPVPQSVKCG